MDDIREKAAAVTLLVLDVDGVLTDGRVYVGPEGEALKVFSMRDGHGLWLVREAGIEVALLTREDSAFVRRRAEKLKIEHVITGSLDKRTALRELTERLGRTREQVAYVGDDVIDLEALEWAGFAACPADAEDEIREIADFIAERPGGHGAVRDICNLLLRSR
jgi:3-deoxy-D-manno-octulosonate 8-phosphate phosphatase (KDO 8-P phosphatase)